MAQIDDINTDPAQGLRLRWALTYYGAYPEMQNALGEDLLHIYQRLRAKQQFPTTLGGQLTLGEQKELASLELIFSERIVERLRAGKLEAKGRVKGNPTVAREVIPADFWGRVQLAIDEDTATADGITVTGLLIFEKSLDSSKVVEPGEKRPPVSYRTTDKVLAEEMQQLIHSAKATGPKDAARIVVGRAQGIGTDESKIKRLLIAFKAL